MDHGKPNRKHSESNTNASPNKRVPFRSSFVYPEPGSANRAPLEPNLKLGTAAKNSDDSSNITTSSSSSDSYSDPFVQVNPKTPPKFKAPNNIPKPSGTPTKSPLYKKNEKFDVSNEALYRLEQSINESPQSTSQFSDIIHESLFANPLPFISPPVQLMERPGPAAFDPSRIPTSIFSKPSTPTEWSVTSNESLFSIHIGNSSLSRDHTARVSYKSGELKKSGELWSSPELQNSWELYQSGEFGMANDVAAPHEELAFGLTPTATAKGVQFDMTRNVYEDMTPRKTKIVDERINGIAMNNRVDANGGDSKDSYNYHRHSDKNITNFQSTVVPRKKKKSLCRCCTSFFCCKWTCFKWPSCSCKCFRWPSCSTKCCKWPSCSSCKCPSCPSCKWPSCPSCKWPSCPSCKWPSCSSCKCRCLSCSSPCCSCWKQDPQESAYDSSISKDHGITGSEKVCPEPQYITRSNSIKASSRKRCSCFTCTSSCSCCSC